MLLFILSGRDVDETIIWVKTILVKSINSVKKDTKNLVVSDKAKIKSSCIKMNKIYNICLTNFKNDNIFYPDTKEGLRALLINPDDEVYPVYSKSGYITKRMKLEKIMIDGWGNKFSYCLENEEAIIISAGKDAKFNTLDDIVRHKDCL